MIIFPAIDLYKGKAVRLLRGDYSQMTVYSDNPASVATGFAGDGAQYVHVVDLEGAADGTTANFEGVKSIISASGLKVEIGGGIRSREVMEKYLAAGVMRVILGTAAVADPEFLEAVVHDYGDKVAVGVDVRDGRVAVKGWREVSGEDCFGFCRRLEQIGVKMVICTDISRDGAMRGTNRALYREMSEKFGFDITASGGVSTLDDITALSALGIYGAIVGKAIYTGDIKLRRAIEVANGN